MTKRIHEAGTIALDKDSDTLRVCLISEGIGSSADFPRAFFVQENADALAESLSFPAHPIDPEHPEQRNPLSAIGSIGKTVTIEEHNGLLSFWSEFVPPKSKPEIGAYLREFGHKLGLSVYADSEGFERDGRWVAESLNPNDPYKSVDLVVAAGRGGKFERVAESLGLITKTSATAEEKEVPTMEIKDVEAAFEKGIAPLTKVVEGLVTALEGKVKADLQIEADDAAVEKIVESRFEAYDAGLKQIAEAKLTESQADEARTILKSGGDIAPFIEKSQKILAEALALAGNESDDDNPTHRVTEHLGDTSKKRDVDFNVAGFGKVRS